MFLLLALVNKCTLKTKDLKNYKSTKYEINEFIEPKTFKLIEKINLEENDEFILNSITGIEIIDSDSNILITCAASKLSAIYDYKTGSLKKIINPNTEEFKWLDYFLKENPIPKQVVRSDLKYIPISEYSKYGLNQQAIDQVKLVYTIPKFINNNIYIASYANMVAVSDEVRHNTLDNRVLICCFDKEFNYKKMIVPEVLYDSYFIMGELEFLSNGEIIGTTSNFSYADKLVSDSLVTVARYDSKGKFLYNIGYLPEKYVKNNLIYEERWQPLITIINDSIFIVYPRDNEIYAPGQVKRFKLKNLPFSNDSGLVFIYDYYRLLKIQNTRPDIKEIGKILPISIINTFNVKGKYNLILLIFDENEPMGFYYIIQEYDTKGNLLSHSKIYDEPENQIRNFYYDKFNNYLCIIRKNKEGWTLEKREWE
jgi:hypothetical protein